jgi:hypothetical protein
LVESISNIQLAALEALWTEETFPFPDRNAPITWEVWLRRDRGVNHLARLRGYAEHFGLTIGEQVVTFIDRTVVLVIGTANNLSRSIDILGMIAEVRLPKVTAAFFTEMTAIEQQQWVDELAARIAPPAAGVPFVCLFDTGLNQLIHFLPKSSVPLTCILTNQLGASMTGMVTVRKWLVSRHLAI